MDGGRRKGPLFRALHVFAGWYVGISVGKYVYM